MLEKEGIKVVLTLLGLIIGAILVVCFPMPVIDISIQSKYIARGFAGGLLNTRAQLLEALEEGHGVVSVGKVYTLSGELIDDSLRYKWVITGQDQILGAHGKEQASDGRLQVAL